ncbi:MAG: chemotaxis protein [Noviherbaspirillum sp.]
MTTSQSGVLDLGRLLSDVSAEGIAHLEAVQADLAQTRLLLAEAISRLSGGFGALHAAVSAQRMAAEELQRQPDSNSAAGQETLRQAAAAIDVQVQAMVTALQFEDMTSQLIAQAGRRIAGLLGILAGVGDGAQSLASGGPDQLDALRAAMAAQSRELDGLLARSVEQKHLESGEITLF